MDKSDDVEKDVKMWQGVTKIDKEYIYGREWKKVKTGEGNRKRLSSIENLRR